MLKRLWRWMNRERTGGQGLPLPVPLLKPPPPPPAPPRTHSKIVTIFAPPGFFAEAGTISYAQVNHGGYDTMGGEE